MPIGDVCSLAVFFVLGGIGAAVFGQAAYLCLRRRPRMTANGPRHWPTKRIPYVLTACALLFWFAAGVFLVVMVVLTALGVVTPTR